MNGICRRINILIEPQCQKAGICINLAFCLVMLWMKKLNEKVSRIVFCVSVGNQSNEKSQNWNIKFLSLAKQVKGCIQ